MHFQAMLQYKLSLRCACRAVRHYSAAYVPHLKGAGQRNQP
jgi:queuine/archaeosine tRNA-ribosyltransferase